MLHPPGVVGRKAVAFGDSAMVSTQHPLVTDAAVDVLREGGNAIDALIVACMVQATVSQELTNHAGTVTVLHYERRSGTVRQLNSPGRIVPGLAPFRPVPIVPATYSAHPPGANAVVPGFMPAMKTCWEQGATLPWARLVEPAIALAEDGHRVTSFEHYVMATTLSYFQHSPSGRAHFTPDGRLPQVGELWRQLELARTLSALAVEGPEHFLTGGWARDFVARGNSMGWPVRLDDLSAHAPQWSRARLFQHRAHTIASLAAPQIQAVSLSFVLGVLDRLGIRDLGHYSEDPLACYYLGHVLRRARIELGHLNDPRCFEDPSDTIMDGDFHAHVARIIAASRPRVDLSEHVELTGRHRRHPETPIPPGTDSCEISIVDANGDWVQAMTTLSGSGIPGEVVGGVPMTGSLTDTSLNPIQNISGWYAGGGDVRTVMGNTMVLRDGEPWLAIGTPGKVEATVPQVLSSILDFGLEPDEAEARPLMMPMDDQYTMAMESRVSDEFVSGLSALGVRMRPLGASDWHMGSFEMCWRGTDGRLRGASGSRREGKSAGL
ncbi:gamma-glutamyltransferase [Microbacterium sp. NPDC058342]|uniref:gamma-glutamyltransferase n=1 Tax=Microbacterium sp. NPDC058342 TaxID=3346454 RepID=UPI00365A6CB5